MLLAPSPRLATLLLVSHAAGAAAVFAAALPHPAKAAILVLVLSSFFYYLARDAMLLLPWSWREILPARDGMSIITRDGSKFTGRATGVTFVSPHFAVLHIRPEGRRRAVARVIFPDAPGRDAFRELSVYLRYAQ